MEIRGFIKPALDPATVRLHMFATFSSTRLNNPNNPMQLKYSQRRAAIGTTNAKLITHILLRHGTNLKLDKKLLFFQCLVLSILL